MSVIVRIVKAFAREEDGASILEYLVLLAVVLALVTGGIAAFSGALNTAFLNWASWVSSNASP
jgi:Flp pilus assembly pilin Flp